MMGLSETAMDEPVNWQLIEFVCTPPSCNLQDVFMISFSRGNDLALSRPAKQSPFKSAPGASARVFGFAPDASRGLGTPFRGRSASRPKSRIKYLCNHFLTRRRVVQDWVRVNRFAPRDGARVIALFFDI
jgi:hypothetical protein